MLVLDGGWMVVSAVRIGSLHRRRFSCQKAGGNV